MRTKTAMCVGHVCVGAAEKKKVVKVVNTILGIYFLCYIVRERGLGGLWGGGGGAMAQCETKTSTENNHL
jgi:hypothetical protein